MKYKVYTFWEILWRAGIIAGLIWVVALAIGYVIRQF